MLAGLIIVIGFAAACLCTPIKERVANAGLSCTVPCLKRKLDPVCGSDGRTYKNPCMLDAQNCGSPIKVVEELFEGVCSTDPTFLRCKKITDRSSGCPDKIDPLCAEDTRTYLNYCDLLQSNCDQKVGIGVVHRGACDSERREHGLPKPTPIVGVAVPEPGSALGPAMTDSSGQSEGLGSGASGDGDVAVKRGIFHHGDDGSVG